MRVFGRNCHAGSGSNKKGSARMDIQFRNHSDRQALDLVSALNREVHEYIEQLYATCPSRLTNTEGLSSHGGKYKSSYADRDRNQCKRQTPLLQYQVEERERERARSRDNTPKYSIEKYTG
jgi:hypothetical protein